MPENKAAFEYLGEDQTYPGSKIWGVKAINVTTTGNRRKFTQEELLLSARGLGFRPLNINHDYKTKSLPFPQNETLAMEYDATEKAVVGTFRVSDKAVNEMITKGIINKVSIEQIPTKGEDCSSGIACEQKGVHFIGLALLTKDVQPGDKNTQIINMESIQSLTETMYCPAHPDTQFPDQTSLLDHILKVHGNQAPGIPTDGAPPIPTPLRGVSQNIENNSDNVQSTQKKTEMSADGVLNQPGASTSGDPAPSTSQRIPPAAEPNTHLNDPDNTGNATKPIGNASGGAAIITMEGKTLSEYIIANTKWMNEQQILLKQLTEQFGIQAKVKNEATIPYGQASTKVSDGPAKALFESTVEKPAKFFEMVKKGLEGDQDFISWNINKEAFFESLKTQRVNTTVAARDGKKARMEAITISAGDMPQIFSKQVYVIPGGRMRVPIRQFLDTQIVEDADRYNWYKIGGFDVNDATAEGTEPTNVAQTITKVQAVPSLLRAVQTVKYTDIENAPFDLIEAINRAASLSALDIEGKEVLTTTYDAITPTNWINGNTAAAIANGYDDVSGMTLKEDAIYGALDLIEEQGGDTTPGNIVFFVHPKALRQLMISLGNAFYTGGDNLSMRQIGVIERRYGIDIVPTNTMKNQQNTTNKTWRNVMMVKGALGLAVAANLQLEAQRRPELSAIKVAARHRIKGAIIDETMTCRISTQQ